MLDYEAVARTMAHDGVPVVSELIWGLPGDTLEEFEKHLDKLTTVFPSHTIYPYALLPGTDLFDRRKEYCIETIELAPYGESKADYIISCHTFDREQGLNGYSLITASILFYRGNIIPLTLRYLALRSLISTSRLLRVLMREILVRFAETCPFLQAANSATVFEKREFVYRWILEHRTVAFNVIREAIACELRSAGHSSVLEPVQRLLLLDEVLCPRTGGASTLEVRFDFAVNDVLNSLGGMELPNEEAFGPFEPKEVYIVHGWDFGKDLVPKYELASGGALRGRYAVWP